VDRRAAFPAGIFDAYQTHFRLNRHCLSAAMALDACKINSFEREVCQKFYFPLKNNL
jgi:hypothetical protein